LLFFEKGSPTKEIWYYEHKLPEGQKSYSKTKPLEFEEFRPIIEWWNNRHENESAWKVTVDDLNDFNLDIKNPQEYRSDFAKTSSEMISDFNEMNSEVEKLLLKIQGLSYEAEEFSEYEIGDFLKRIKRPIELEDSESYQLVTVKLHHKGVVPRTKKKGSEIKSKMFKVHVGDFILSGIDARNGAFGIVPKELDGAIVTNDFWYFDIDNSIIDKEFFLEMTSTDWFDDLCNKGSDGTTQRIRLQKDKFFNQRVRLPQMKEQRALVEKLKLISGLQKLLQSGVGDAGTLKQTILNEAFHSKADIAHA
jgi:type I restriction enzyme M protein